MKNATQSLITVEIYGVGNLFCQTVDAHEGQQLCDTLSKSAFPILSRAVEKPCELMDIDPSRIEIIFPQAMKDYVETTTHEPSKQDTARRGVLWIGGEQTNLYVYAKMGLLKYRERD